MVVMKSSGKGASGKGAKGANALVCDLSEG
jgi:hypothetical protein